MRQTENELYILDGYALTEKYKTFHIFFENLSRRGYSLNTFVLHFTFLVTLLILSACAYQITIKSKQI